MRTKTKVILALAGLFILGFISGYLVSNALISTEPFVMPERPEQVEERQEAHPGRGRGAEDHMRRRLTETLDLDEAQRDVYFEHLTEYRSAIRSEIQEHRRQEHEVIQQHYENLRSELTELLSPQQLEKMDSFLHPDSAREHMRMGPGAGRHRQDGRRERR